MDNRTVPYYSDGEPQFSIEELKTYLKENYPGNSIVSDDKVQQLINQKRELQTIVKSSVEIIVFFYGLIGNKMPSSVIGWVSIGTGIMKKFNEKPDLLKDVAIHFDTIQQLAPNHVAPEVIKQLEVFAPKNTDKP